MLLEELHQLVSHGESQTLEFKKSTGQRSEATKTVCAFLNGLGGFVVFGVSDKGEVFGQQVAAKTLEDIAFELRRIEPPAFPEVETVAIGNPRAVIVIRVPGKQGTYAYDGRSYIRHGPTTRIMPHEEYERRTLEKFHAHQRWENEPAPDWVTIDDLDEEAIRIALRNAIHLGRIKKPPDTDLVSILRGFGLFDGGKLLNAAVALFGKGERIFSTFPQLSIRLARFRGEDRIGGFLDNRQYTGHAFDLLSRGESFLLDHVPIAGQVVSGKMAREDYPLYPPLATREALANAICHRDYTIPGGSVAIAMYDHHLEIINPGIFHFDITPEKLLLPHESKPWNPIIASAFYRAGIIEKWGTGTLNILNRCKENKNPPPTWEIRTHSVVATFTPSRFFSIRQAQDGPKIGLRQAQDGPEPLNQEILYLLQKESLSSHEIAKKLGHKTISGGLKRSLQELLAKEVIALTIPQKPRSKFQKYTLHRELWESEPHASQNKVQGPKETPYINPLHNRFLKLSPQLKREIANLSKRCPRAKIEEAIKQLCSICPLQPRQLGQILDRDAHYLRIHFLSKMLRRGELVYEYPDQPAHPQQAYKTPN